MIQIAILPYKSATVLIFIDEAHTGKDPVSPGCVIRWLQAGNSGWGHKPHVIITSQKPKGFAFFYRPALTSANAIADGKVVWIRAILGFVLFTNSGFRDL